MILANARLIFAGRLARDHIRVADGKIAAISDQALGPAAGEPARALRAETPRGVLQVGANADLVSFTDDFQVPHTFVAGRDVR